VRRSQVDAGTIRPTKLVFLVPGFFGFTSVGAVSYFENVEQALGRAVDQSSTSLRSEVSSSRPRFEHQ
jgi:hypothetical protein